jgi:hypothetical protein
LSRSGIAQVAACLARLQLGAAELFLHFADDVCQTQQVLLGPFELAERFLLVGFELADPRRLLEDHAPIHFRGLKELVDLPLLDDRIGADAHPGVHEQFADILQAADLVVDQVFAFAAPVQTPGDVQAVLFDAQPAYRKNDSDTSANPLGLRLLDPAEMTSVICPLPCLRALVAQNPLHRVNDVLFPQPLGPTIP